MMMACVYILGAYIWTEKVGHFKKKTSFQLKFDGQVHCCCYRVEGKHKLGSNDNNLTRFRKKIHFRLEQKDCSHSKEIRVLLIKSRFNEIPINLEFLIFRIFGEDSQMCLG